MTVQLFICNTYIYIWAALIAHSQPVCSCIHSLLIMGMLSYSGINVQTPMSSYIAIQAVPLHIRIRIHLLARRNLLWDILRLPSSRRAMLGLYVIFTLCMTSTGCEPATTHITASELAALRHCATEDDDVFKHVHLTHHGHAYLL